MLFNIELIVHNRTHYNVHAIYCGYIIFPTENCALNGYRLPTNITHFPILVHYFGLSFKKYVRYGLGNPLQVLYIVLVRLRNKGFFTVKQAQGSLVAEACH